MKLNEKAIEKILGILVAVISAILNLLGSKPDEVTE